MSEGCPCCGSESVAVTDIGISYCKECGGYWVKPCPADCVYRAGDRCINEHWHCIRRAEDYYTPLKRG